MRRWLLCVAVMMSVGMTGMAESRVAVVDMMKLVKEHPQEAINRSVLSQEKEEFEAEQEKMLGDLEALKKGFEAARDDARNEALSEAARKEKMTAAEQKYVALRKLERKARETVLRRQREIADQKLRMRRRVVGKLQEVIEAHASKAKIDLVIDSSAVGASGAETVVYAIDRLDITEDILKLIKKDK